MPFICNVFKIVEAVLAFLIKHCIVPVKVSLAVSVNGALPIILTVFFVFHNEICQQCVCVLHLMKNSTSKYVIRKKEILQCSYLRKYRVI